MYAYGSSWTTPNYKYASFYQCKTGYFPRMSSASYCVAEKPGVTVVQGPPDACASQPCKNGGTCIPSDSKNYKTGVYTGAFRCTCAQGYFSKYPDRSCATKWVDPCASNPCQNHGTCRSRSGSTYASCSCLSGYIGRTCDTVWQDSCTSNPCLNGATCSSYKSSLNYRCSCAHSTTDAVLYGGANCGTEFDDPCETDPCVNGGTCTSSASTYSKSASYYCRCASGYMGKTCSMKPSKVGAAVCAKSQLQMCKRMCPPNPRCAAGQCLMHTDNCCGRKCQAVKCSSSDCCYSAKNNFCACSKQRVCSRVRCLIGPPKGACAAAPTKGTCTAAETAAGKTFTSCGTSCPPTCGQSTGRMCNMMCLMGCQCRGKNSFWDPKQSKCVTKSQCTVAPPPPRMDGIMIGRPFTTAAYPTGLTADAVTAEW